MSVNRNILLNSATPLAGDISPTEVNLVTTSGSRWVILDFLNTVPTSSNGSCTAVTLEWSPDPSMVTNPFQPSSSYYAVTSSVFSCESASLSPQTGSIAWIQFIDSYWPPTYETPTGIPTEYYLRAIQTRNTSPVSIYSPVVPVETRAVKYCGTAYTSSILVPAIVADMDSFNSPPYSGAWVNDYAGLGVLAGLTASFSSGFPDTSGSSWKLVKAGGPNFDALRVDNNNFVNWPGLTISSAAPVRCGVGIVRGAAEWTITSNGIDFLIRVQADETPTTSSIIITKPSTGDVVGTISPDKIPTNLQNTYVELVLRLNPFITSEIKVDNNGVGGFDLAAFGASGGITLKDNFKMTVYGPGTGYLPDTGIIRCVTAQMPYNPTVFHCKYGPVGASSYVA